MRQVMLDDKFTQDKGAIFLNGTQALVRLLLVQRRRDLALGLNTAGFVSGYRGSPLGGLDMALWRAGRYLKSHQIRFQPGLNEDLGATAVWGTQQLHLFPGAQVDGVFSMWYAKGPGVDRSGDALKHANAAGTSRLGGVLALAGDDHACKSSSLPHQSDFGFIDAGIPMLFPANLQEVLDWGLYGWALSRYAGVWCGLKLISDTVDTSASVYTDPNRIRILTPDDFEMPSGGLNIRWPDPPLEQEKRLHLYKLPAVGAFVRAHQLDQVIWKGKKPRIGFVAAGKAYNDLRQAFADMGIDEGQAEKLGIALYKPALVWPLEKESLLAFAKGLSYLVFVEEKRALMESQAKEILYHVNADERPTILGKTDKAGAPLFPSVYELNAQQIALLVAGQLQSLCQINVRLPDTLQTPKVEASTLQRLPYYCSGCPHNTSTTQVPEGSRVMAGIGCHYMAMWIAPDATKTFTHMGAEGVPWVGQAPFTSHKHVFANLGDGTYFHSGTLAIRQAVAAKVNITYKILYNDAVAMTGGQPVDGQLSPAQITQQIYAEGVRRIAVVSDDLGRYGLDDVFAPGTTLHHRDTLLAVEKDLQLWPGVSVLVYDQTCAAEKRRRRKRGLMDDPAKRLFINETVCEGCGDCGKASNCVSILPLETEWGRKRVIDQSSCNKDYSCVKGFCPSFVSVIGGKVRQPKPVQTAVDLFAQLPNPQQLVLDKPYNIFVTGIGGTGVITVGALLGMAAHLEGKGCSIVDMAGLAQKGGAVVSHIRVASCPDDIQATRISPQGADLILGCDLVTTSTQEGIEKIAQGRTRLVVNSHQTPTGHFAQNPDHVLTAQTMHEVLNKAAGDEAIDWIDATGLAVGLLGDVITANVFQLGYAVQKGLIPISPEAILETIRLNDVAVEMNTHAFQWGRLAAVDLETVRQHVRALHPSDSDHQLSETLDQKITRRAAFLQDYQNQAYAQRYQSLVNRVRNADQALNQARLSEIVAQTYFRLMAYKDEYEVARLYTHDDFKRRLASQFEGNYRLEFHLAPPLWAHKDEQGRLTKSTYGPWILKAFKILSKFKFLRNTPFDVFGYAQERRMERLLIQEFEEFIERILPQLSVENYDVVCELARLPQDVRGYGHVKEANYANYCAKREALFQQSTAL